MTNQEPGREAVELVWCRCNNAAEFIAVSPEGLSLKEHRE